MTIQEMLGRAEKAAKVADALEKAGITAEMIRECPPTAEQWDTICYHAGVNRKRPLSDKTIAAVIEILDGAGAPPIMWGDEVENG